MYRSLVVVSGCWILILSVGLGRLLFASEKERYEERRTWAIVRGNLEMESEESFLFSFLLVFLGGWRGVWFAGVGRSFLSAY